MVLYELQRQPTGLVDDLLVEPTSFTISQTSEAQYEFRFELTESSVLLVRLWTTKKGKIEALLGTEALNAPAPGIRCIASPEGRLISLEALNCGVHLEQMDRGHYWLGMFAPDSDLIHVNFHAHGYIESAAEELSSRQSDAPQA